MKYKTKTTTTTEFVPHFWIENQEDQSCLAEAVCEQSRKLGELGVAHVVCPCPKCSVRC